MEEKSTLTPQEAAKRVEERNWKPRNGVWELTLACNLRCKHCGSKAGTPRPNEMSTDECLRVADELGELGAELVTLSGGEPTMHPGWHKIAERLAKHGILVNMVTNGVYKNGSGATEIAQQAADAGLSNIGISVDGPEDVHDAIRGRGTYAKTISSIEQFAAAGMKVGVLTTVNTLNFLHLEAVRQTAMALNVNLWRLQLAKPMGSMREHDDWVITPTQLLQLIPRLSRLKKQGGIHLAVGDSIGYYGPHDKVLRGRGWRGRKESWQGCQAGMQAIGIEADGGVKGCLSLQAKWGETDPFVEGNLRGVSLAELWNSPGVFAYNRDFQMDSLTGHCAACRYGKICRGGATCVASSFLGHVNEDPYCYHRLAALMHPSRSRMVAQSAAAATAALFLSLGAQGCFPDSQPEYGMPAPDASDTVSSDVAPEPDLCCEPDYGIPLDVKPEPDQCCAPEYGVFPDVQVDYGMPPDVVTPDVVEPDVQLDYGMPPDVVEPDVQMEYGMPPDVVEPEVQMDYGMPPDVVTHDAKPDAINCDDVCCECEYGIIPEEVWKECCEPDPCENACCDCDYGEPPPSECCD